MLFLICQVILTFLAGYIVGQKVYDGFSRRKDNNRALAQYDLGQSMQFLVMEYNLPDDYFFTLAGDCLVGAGSYNYIDFGRTLNPVLNRAVRKEEFVTFVTLTINEQYVCAVTCIQKVLSSSEVTPQFKTALKEVVRNREECQHRYP